MVLSIIMAVFSVLGGIDLILGDRFGLGKEFKKGFVLFEVMALSMIGMIIWAPFLGQLMVPISDWVYNTLGLDPSIIPSMFLANDMGGAALASSMAKTDELAMFNGLVVSSMLGCTISFTIPVALGIVKKEQHKLVLSGFLCGIVTIPTGCFIAGLIQGIDIVSLFVNILPMVVFSGIIACGLAFFPAICIKIFGLLGAALKVLITIGLILGIVKYLTGVEIIKGLDTLEEGGRICFNASVVMTGAFPFLHIVSKIIAKPLKAFGKLIGVNEASAFGFFSSVATNITTFNAMGDMDDKGAMLNSAFAVSASFTFAGHLAFTLSFNSECVLYMIVGKLISGILAVILANFVYNRINLK